MSHDRLKRRNSEERVARRLVRNENRVATGMAADVPSQAKSTLSSNAQKNRLLANDIISLNPPEKQKHFFDTDAKAKKQIQAKAAKHPSPKSPKPQPRQCNQRDKSKDKLHDKIDYRFFGQSIVDPDLRNTLCLESGFEELLEKLTQENIFQLDSKIKTPFFAEIRGYSGAVERKSGDCWIVKPIKKSEILETATGAIVYFLDRFVSTLSAPTVIARIDSKLFRATKIIEKAEQLSGANYSSEDLLIEQLLLDTINRWIYADEDRNPNNYMIRPDFKNKCFPVVVPIDFGNSDLKGKTLKIAGKKGDFGWIRTEKTQYLTPLKTSAFMNYDMTFFDQRFSQFNRVDEQLLVQICDKVFSLCPEIKDSVKIKEKIAKNILFRINYVYNYFKQTIPAIIENKNKEKYAKMGKAFSQYYC